jgi:UDP-N-acetylmuramate dehydrogenase
MPFPRWSRRRRDCLPPSEAVVQRDVPLGAFTTLGIGGAARAFVRAETQADVVTAQRWSLEHGVNMFVLGGGSNLVVADEGFDGIVVQIGLRGTAFVDRGDDTLITAAAGETWDDIVAAAVERGLSGLECLSGIPGSVGGTPIQNVGAYGQEVADTIESVVVIDRTDGRIAELTAGECGFSYRMSRFKSRDAGRFIVFEVTFRLDRRTPIPTYPDVIRYLESSRVVAPMVADVRQAVLAIRRRKGMVLDPGDADTRSVGSFFMNPVVPGATREQVSSIAGAAAPAFDLADGRVKLPAAWLIEHAGFHKGFADGCAGISTKHPLALVNRGGATARDMLRLAKRIKQQVADRFGVFLVPEPIFVGFARDPDVEYLRGREATDAA